MDVDKDGDDGMHHVCSDGYCYPTSYNKYAPVPFIIIVDENDVMVEKVAVISLQKKIWKGLLYPAKQ